MTEVMKYLVKYLRALGFVSVLICLILETDFSKVGESTAVGVLLYCGLLGTLIIWSVYYTYDFIKTFYTE